MLKQPDALSSLAQLDDISLGQAGFHAVIDVGDLQPALQTRLRDPILSVRLSPSVDSDILDSMSTNQAADDSFPYWFGMSTNRENMPWNATVIVSVGPLRCLATMKSASPWRGLSFS